jgi:hypothetical protein
MRKIGRRTALLARRILAPVAIAILAMLGISSIASDYVLTALVTVFLYATFVFGLACILRSLHLIKTERQFTASLIAILFILSLGYVLLDGSVTAYSYPDGSITSGLSPRSGLIGRALRTVAFNTAFGVFFILVSEAVLGLGRRVLARSPS